MCAYVMYTKYNIYERTHFFSLSLFSHKIVCVFARARACLSVRTYTEHNIYERINLFPLSLSLSLSQDTYFMRQNVVHLILRNVKEILFLYYTLQRCATHIFLHTHPHLDVCILSQTRTDTHTQICTHTKSWTRLFKNMCV